MSRKETGKWLCKGDYAVCSECGGSSGTQFDGIERIPRTTAFCPNCGARMLRGDMKKVFIKKNTLGDTRTAEHMPTREEFNDANELHINDVKHLTRSFCDEMLERISHHDWTKMSEPYATMFYDDMKANIEDGKEPFVDLEWYKLHVNTERHHLNDRVPDDVDLIDVVERLVDSVSAGMARSGSVYDVTVPDDVLQKAVANTVNKMIRAVIVYDPANVVESEVKR